MKGKHSIRLEGLVASAGHAIGSAVVVRSIRDMKRVDRRSVLVCKDLTPDYMIFGLNSAAIVTEIGGMLSHAAVTSRELGIPCIIAVRKATQRIRNGALVEVDGERGLVSVYEA